MPAPKQDADGHTIGSPSGAGETEEVILNDAAKRRRYKEGRRAEARDRILALFREPDGEEMDFTEPVPPKPTLLGRAKGFLARRRTALARVWHWNIAFPVKTWWHFRFHREEPLEPDATMIAAMLRDDFARLEITDSEIFGHVRDVTDTKSGSQTAKRHESDGEPWEWDRFFNGRRVNG